MRFLKILIILFLVSIPFSSNWAYSDIDANTKTIYTKFYAQIKNKYKSDSWLSYLYLLEKTLASINNSGKLTKNNEKIILDLEKLNNEKIFNLELESKEKVNKLKIANNSLLDDYELFFYNPDALIKENWVWYTYSYTKKYFFEESSKLNRESLIYNGLYWKNIVVYYDNWNLSFIKDYKKVKLITDDIIYGFPNKYELLKTIRNNKLFDASRDDDSYYKTLEKTSKELTSWIYKDDEKIKIIYDYILKNISYSNNFTMQDYKIFSWVETYSNKSWVCEWYVELFNLMLWFNNIKSSIIIWDVIDASDFPQIWHAWVKIGEYYYDITFDDPVWATKTKTFNEYSYYKLPKDLFYTNRFDKWLTPENLKTSTLDFRKALIKSNLSKLIEKYKNNNYNLLKIFKFKEKYGISATKDIAANDIIKILWYKDMKNFEVVVAWKTKYIKNLNYISLEDDTIETFLEQINFDLTWYVVLKWLKDDWNIEFIISNNITYHN